MFTHGIECQGREQFLYGVFAAATLRAKVDTFEEMEQYAYCCCEVGIPSSEAQPCKVASLSCRESAHAGTHGAGLSKRLMFLARPD